MAVPRVVELVRRGYTIPHDFQAMEFAITVLAKLLELMTPGCRTAPGVFVLPVAADWS
jgi:hypothetical protein